MYQKNPQPGPWKLQKKSVYSWVINVTAQSALHFTANILETSTDGNSYQLSGNPIKGTFFPTFFILFLICLILFISLSIVFASGNNYSVAVDIENLNTNSTCTSVALLDDSGNDVTEIFVTRVYLMEITRYIGKFTPYNRVNTSMTPTLVMFLIKDV